MPLQLKRPWKESRSTKLEVVDALIERLQLTQSAHVVIGDPMTKGISGGQAKVGGAEQWGLGWCACVCAGWCTLQPRLSRFLNNDSTVSM